MPAAHGEAKVESKQGYMEVEVEFDNLQSATRFGPEFLTYVMWTITPEGRATNMGEVILNGTKSKLDVTTELQAFGLVVTAEPYFGVTQPSDVVVMENFVRTDTVGKVEEIDAKYELLQRGQYTVNVSAGRPEADPIGQEDTAGSLRSAKRRAHREMGRRGQIGCRKFRESQQASRTSGSLQGEERREQACFDDGTRSGSDC